MKKKVKDTDKAIKKDFLMKDSPQVEGLLYRDSLFELHKNSVDFARSAIQYMFVANGGAPTTILLKFDISEYYVAIVFFLTGTMLTIILPILFYFRCNSVVSLCVKGKTDSLYIWSKNGILKIFCYALIVVPVLFFSFGILFSIEIFNGNKNPTIWQVIKLAWKAL